MNLNILTQRCKLAPLTEDDFDEVVVLYTNEDVMRYLGGVRPIEPILNGLRKSIKSNAFLGRLRKLLKFGTNYIFTLKLEDTNEFIGLIFVSPHHNKFDTEVSYIILPHFWGKGYAFEGVKATLEFCKTELRLKRVVSETQVANERSIRLLQRLGFTVKKELDRFGEKQALFEFNL